MKLLLLLSCTFIVVAAMAKAAVLPNSGMAISSVYLRAGAKSNPKQTSLGNSKAGKRKKNSTKYGKTFRRGQSKVPGLHDKLKKLTKQGKSVLNDVYRRAKVLRSSAFEAMLLKATWPSNEPVQPEILGEIIKYSIPAFKFSSADSEDDPYYMTLHKLWTKMYETDWRTVVKSLYILHTILRDCQADACTKFGSAIKDMAKTRNPKNPDHRYFDVQKIGELSEPNVAAGLQDYVTHYAEYVVFRAKSFTARFDELKALNEKSSEKKVLAVLKKAQQCITLGLKAQTSEKKQINAITAYTTKQVSADLRDLFALYGEKITLFTTAGGKYAASAGPKSLPAIAEALKFYQDTEPKLKSYLTNNAKQYVRLRVKIPTDLQDRNKGPTAEAIATRLKEIQVSSLSGGATPSNGKCTRNTTKQGTCTRRRLGSVNPSKTSKTPKVITPQAPSSSSATSSSANSLLRRADRPLTPEEVQASIELSSFDLPPLSSAPGNTLSADRLACSGSADGACGVRDRVEGLMQHSAGAKRRSSQHDDDDEEDDDEEDDDEEEMEEEDELLDQDEEEDQGQYQTDRQQEEDEEDDFDNEEGENYEGEEVGVGVGEGEEDYDLDQDEDDMDDDEGEDNLQEVGLERSKAYLQEQKRRAAQKQQQQQAQNEDEQEEGDESVDAEAEEEVNEEEEEEGDGDE